MKTKKEILIKHWSKVTDRTFDGMTEKHLSYVFDAMDEYAAQFSAVGEKSHSVLHSVKERSLPLTRPMIEDLINHAYQRGYEDRDLDIGHGSNRQYSIDEIDRKLKAHKLTSP